MLLQTSDLILGLPLGQVRLGQQGRGGLAVQTCLIGVRADAAVENGLGLLGQIVDGLEEEVEIPEQGVRGSLV